MTPCLGTPGKREMFKLVLDGRFRRKAEYRGIEHFFFEYVFHDKDGHCVIYRSQHELMVPTGLKPRLPRTYESLVLRATVKKHHLEPSCAWTQITRVVIVRDETNEATGLFGEPAKAPLRRPRQSLQEMARIRGERARRYQKLRIGRQGAQRRQDLLDRDRRERAEALERDAAGADAAGSDASGAACGEPRP